MKTRFHDSLAFLLLFAWGSATCCSQYWDNEQAVMVKVPVADCLGKAAEEIDPAMNPEQFYAHLAYSPEKGPYSCPRIHQCLFNEVGVICGEKRDELLVEFPQFYYRDPKGDQVSRFWLLKSGLQRLRDLDKSLMIAHPAPLE